MTNEYESLDIYLYKDGEIVGLHAIGDANSSWTVEEMDGTRTQRYGFKSVESWGNYYNDRYEMQGRGSFRCGHDIEAVAKDFESDGWKRFKRQLELVENNCE